jgi:hypothetical protein
MREPDVKLTHFTVSSHSNRNTVLRLQLSLIMRPANYLASNYCKDKCEGSSTKNHEVQFQNLGAATCCNLWVLLFCTSLDVLLICSIVNITFHLCIL